MGKKKANIFERLADKLVLGFIGLLSLFFLWVFILSGPYSVEYMGYKLGPGEVDQRILTTAASRLDNKLDEPPEPKVYNIDNSRIIAQFLERSITDVDTQLAYPLPSKTSGGDIGKVYAMPEIPPASDIKVNAIRTTVFEPKEVVDIDHPYSSVPAEYSDMDFITVSAKIEISTLYENFQSSFNGPMVKEEWRNETYANPVFAQVELQRRVLNSDGSTGSWENVPRSRIDHLRQYFDFDTEISGQSSDLSLLLVQFNDFDIQRQLLQPIAYDIAVSDEEWYPPGIYGEYEKVIEKQKIAERRSTLASRREEDRRTSNRRSSRGNTGGVFGGGGGTALPEFGGGQTGGIGGGGSSRSRSTSRRSSRRNTRSRYDRRDDADRRRRSERRDEPDLKDVQEQYEDILIDDDTNFERMEEPLVFWSHDDTAEPGKRYQYRIRVGVFNPVAGKDWFREDQKDLKNDSVLWSDYTEPSEVLELMPMKQFFPMEVVDEADKSVKVKVARFYHGKWRSYDFTVFPGQFIGSKVEIEEEKQDSQDPYGGGMGYRNQEDKDSEEPEEIDFSTDAKLVDLDQVEDWGGYYDLRKREYYQILYSYSSQPEEIERYAVRNRFWPDNLSDLYSIVDRSSDKDVELVDRKTKKSSSRSREFDLPVMPDYPPGGQGPAPLPGFPMNQ